MADIGTMVAHMEVLVRRVRDGTRAVDVGACRQSREVGFPFLAGGVRRRTVELCEAREAPHEDAYGEPCVSGRINKTVVGGRVRDPKDETENRGAR